MILLSAAQIAEHRFDLRSLLVRAADVSRGEFTADDLLQAAADGKLSIFVPALSDLSAVLVVDIFTTFGLQYAMVIAMAGDVKKLYEDRELFDHWARFMGCSEVRMACTESRERLFKRQGFKRLYAVCGYSLEDET